METLIFLNDQLNSQLNISYRESIGFAGGNVIEDNCIHFYLYKNEYVDSTKDKMAFCKILVWEQAYIGQVSILL